MIHVYKYPSLELRWLPNSFLKSISTMPLLIHDDCTDAGGYFIPPQEDTRWIVGNNERVDGDRPVIATATTTGPGTIAHEMRHLWQWDHGDEGPGSGKFWRQWAAEMSYREAIIKYFTRFWTELDALRFELIHGPEDHTLEWAEWLKEAGCAVLRS